MTLKFKSRLSHKAAIDITSLIDLVFLLVAFFMVTSSLGSESTITVHLPRAVQTGEYKVNNLIISITNSNNIYINDVEFTKNELLDELKNRAQQLADDATVVIRGDRKADYETIVYIMDMLNQAGIPRFTISTVKGSSN